MIYVSLDEASAKARLLLPMTALSIVGPQTFGTLGGDHTTTCIDLVRRHFRAGLATGDEGAIIPVEAHHHRGSVLGRRANRHDRAGDW